VDDHPLIRAGIGGLLEGEPDLRVIGEASTGEEGVELTRRLEPDLVVMDLSMPGCNGLEATRLIAAMGIATRVLILTIHGEEEYLMPVMEAGASGYLNKNDADRDLLTALRVVSRGEVYLPARARRLLLERCFAASTSRHADDQDLRTLSAREREVMALTAEGFTAREVGERLLISSKSVDTYRARLMEKLGIEHRSQLVRLALKTGLLSLDQWPSRDGSPR
jgi:two-component system response regulator NreC